MPTPATTAPPDFQPTITRIRQPNGDWIVKVGELRLVSEISVREFARRAHLSPRRVIELCESGEIQHRRLTPVPRSKIIIPIQELETFLARTRSQQ